MFATLFIFYFQSSQNNIYIYIFYIFTIYLRLKEGRGKTQGANPPLAQGRALTQRTKRGCQCRGREWRGRGGGVDAARRLGASTQRGGVDTACRLGALTWRTGQGVDAAHRPGH